MPDEVIEDGVNLRPELDDFRTAQQTFVGTVEPKRIKEDARVVHRALPEIHDSFTTVTRIPRAEWFNPNASG
jgi:hypothetical protein